MQVLVWIGLTGNLVSGPYILRARLNAANYLEFLLEELPTLLRDVALNIGRHMRIQMHGEPPHFRMKGRNFINNNYPQWIGRGASVTWPLRPSDHNALDFCSIFCLFWGE